MYRIFLIDLFFYSQNLLSPTFVKFILSNDILFLNTKCRQKVSRMKFKSIKFYNLKFLINVLKWIVYKKSNNDLVSIHITFWSAVFGE